MTAQTLADLAAIDWDEESKRAAIRYDVIDGRPINPFEPHLPEGLGELWFWGEGRAADAVVFLALDGRRHVLLIKRGDGHGWAVPGGGIDPGEMPENAAERELLEEAGLDLAGHPRRTLPVRYVPDPRAGRNAWMVTWPSIFDLGEVDELPVVVAASDADEATWVYAEDYGLLVAALSTMGGRVFVAHVHMLAELLG